MNVLEEHEQTGLSQKENKLFDIDFGYKNIDELVVVFNNTKTDEEHNELFDKIVNKLTLLKKLINTVSGVTEKKIINNVIKGIEFVLDYVASNINFSYSGSDSKQHFSYSEFSNTTGSGLEILTPNQMLSILPISLAQLKAGNNSKKLKNEIRQFLYSL